MSAKDKAFEVERTKLRQKVRELELLNQKLREREYLLREELRKSKDELRSKEEHVERLLEYMDYQPEELSLKVASEKAISTVSGIIGAIGMGRSWRL